MGWGRAVLFWRSLRSGDLEKLVASMLEKIIIAVLAMSLMASESYKALLVLPQDVDLRKSFTFAHLTRKASGLCFNKFGNTRFGFLSIAYSVMSGASW